MTEWKGPSAWGSSSGPRSASATTATARSSSDSSGHSGARPWLDGGAAPPRNGGVPGGGRGGAAHQREQPWQWVEQARVDFDWYAKGSGKGWTYDHPEQRRLAIMDTPGSDDPRPGDAQWWRADDAMGQPDRWALTSADGWTTRWWRNWDWQPWGGPDGVGRGLTLQANPATAPAELRDNTGRAVRIVYTANDAEELSSDDEAAEECRKRHEQATKDAATRVCRQCAKRVP